MSIFQRLRDSWQAQSVRLCPRATDEKLFAFEEKHSVKLPPEFKQYLKTAGGMHDGETDKHLICFASMSALDDETRWISSDDMPQGVIFADYSVFAHYYVLCLTEGTVIAADGEHSLKLTDSFHEFIENYLADPASIANCWTADVQSP